MALAIGTQLGSMEVTALIGRGGMGEVYRARDSKLKREVAIKILPDEFLRDPDRASRFQREAEVLASLNHPNIAAIYDLEEAQGSRYLVLELVEGETLADRIARGPIPVEEALDIAKHICEALEAAHEKSIIHRDLKPANVKITPEGKVKVLDFGLAKAMSGTAPATTLSNSPTLVSGSMGGMIVGTAAYMSPEQARGREADQRSDVFAFGCLLYEMLTGRQAFQGEDVSDLLAAVLRTEPDFSVLPSNLNPRLLELLRRCLAKNRKDRWHAVGDLRVEIEAVIADPHGALVEKRRAVTRGLSWKSAIPYLITAVLSGVIAGIAMWYLKPSNARPVMRFSVPLVEGVSLRNNGSGSVAISPDGTQMAYVADRWLYHRALADSETRPIPGVEFAQGGYNPAFSPDGRSVVFYSLEERKIKRIPVTGGTPVTICEALFPSNLNWTEDWIVFAQGPRVMRVSANGGNPELLATVKNDQSVRSAQLLPGGEAVLYQLQLGPITIIDDKNTEVVVRSLRSSQQKILFRGGSEPRYLPTGHIVYALGGTLFAVPFDLRRLEVTGGPVPVVEGIWRTYTGAAQFSFSNTGSLIYVPGPASTTGAFQQRLALMDRKGGIEALKIPPGPYGYPRVSRDGKRIAVGTDNGREAVIWIYDLSSARPLRQLTIGGANRYPIWSADGERVAYQSDREGDLGIFWQRADGTGAAERLTRADKDVSHVPDSWSPDNQHFSFTALKGNSEAVWIFSLQDKKATLFGEASSPRPTPTNSAFSPDGRWIAYQSGDAATAGILVQPFPMTATKYQIAKRATYTPHHPLWSPDGKEIFYIPGPLQFVAAGIAMQPSFTLGDAVLMLRGGLQEGGSNSVRNYDIMPDGKLFLIVVPADQTQSGPPATVQIQVVLNWFTELQQRVPVH